MDFNNMSISDLSSVYALTFDTTLKPLTALWQYGLIGSGNERVGYLINVPCPRKQVEEKTGQESILT
mgnify:CR=1 FL=1